MKPCNSHELPVCSNGERLDFARVFYVSLKSQNADGSAEFVLRMESGYSWDGASIPRYLWWLFGKPLSPEFRLASLWHDRLCELSECIEDRIIADAVFLRLLKDAGVKKWRRVAMWAGVRFYATFIWRFKRWLQKR
jgi:hypothetical protein